MATKPKSQGIRAWGILAPARMARAVGIVITLGVILLFLTEVPLLDQLELKTYDMRLRALPRTAPQHVTIAAIDEKSLAKLGRWPWSRSTFAELVQRLDELGAKVIAFDVFFSERESARADAQFASADAVARSRRLRHRRRQHRRAADPARRGRAPAGALPGSRAHLQRGLDRRHPGGQSGCSALARPRRADRQHRPGHRRYPRDALR